MGARGAVIGCSVVCLLIFGLTPSIVWLTIGTRYKHDPCNDFAKTPDLATWLIVAGAAGVGNVFFMFVLYGGTMCIASDSCKVLGGTGICVSIYYLVLSSMFFLGWAILGAVRLSDDEVCEHSNSTLYNTALAAVIITLVNGFVTSCQAGSSSGAKN